MLDGPVFQRLLLIAAAAAVVVAPAAAGAPSGRGGPQRVYVAPNGSDLNPCTAALPCQSYQRGYLAAQPGQTVELAGGTYPGQDLTYDPAKTSTEHVTLEPAKGASVLVDGRLTLAGARHLTLKDIGIGRSDAYWDLLLQPCNSDITFENVGGGRYFGILEGNRDITFNGGSWGGYGAPGEHDSAIGWGGEDLCDGSVPGPSHNLVFDHVTWHDSFWGQTPEQWGGAHPDCLEIDGSVNGLTIRNSVFTRCGDSFLAVYGDLGGPVENVTIEHNLFQDGATYGYWGIQLTDDGHPYHCSGIVFRDNVYLPNSPNAGIAYTPLRTDCSGAVPTQIVHNTFQVGPNDYACGIFQANALWDHNRYLIGDPCGTHSVLQTKK
jgi:hypothetical protein